MLVHMLNFFAVFDIHKDYRRVIVCLAISQKCIKGHISKNMLISSRKFTKGTENVHDDVHPCKTLKYWKKSPLIIVKWLLEKLLDNFFGCFGYEMCGSEICSNIQKLLMMTTTLQICSKGYNWWRNMNIWYWCKNQKVCSPFSSITMA